MSRQIFINLPVRDLAKSMKFYTALGCINNPQFSDESGKCMVWSDTIYVMLLSHAKFTSFTSKPISDAHTHISGLYSLSLESVDEMHDIMTKGLGAGGNEPHEMRDYGFMQQRTIEDPDGHTWELFYMDMSQFAT